MTLADAKSWLQVVHTSDDALINLQIAAACALLDGPDGMLSRSIGGGAYDLRFEGVSAGDRLGFGLHGRAQSDVSINGAAASAQGVKHEHGWAYLEADEAWLTDGECTLGVTFAASTDMKVKALALTITAQLYEFRAESITEQVRNNPVVRRMIEASKKRWVA